MPNLRLVDGYRIVTDRGEYISGVISCGQSSGPNGPSVVQANIRNAISVLNGVPDLSSLPINSIVFEEGLMRFKPFWNAPCEPIGNLTSGSRNISFSDDSGKTVAIEWAPQIHENIGLSFLANPVPPYVSGAGFSAVSGELGPAQIDGSILGPVLLDSPDVLEPVQTLPEAQFDVWHII